VKLSKNYASGVNLADFFRCFLLNNRFHLKTRHPQPCSATVYYSVTPPAALLGDRVLFSHTAVILSVMKTTAIIAGIAVLLALLLGCGIGIRGGPLPQTRSTVEIITLDVPVDAPESAWTAALAAWKNGSAEYPLKAATVAGRVDVLTDCCAIEVEWHPAA